MNTSPIRILSVPFRSLLLLVAAFAMGAMTRSAAAQWTEWGGQHQDFKPECSKLADEWPDEGPKKLWSHKLGEGYSAILVDGDFIYTMYRTRPDEKAAKAEEAKAGKKAQAKNADEATDDKAAADEDGDDDRPRRRGRRGNRGKAASQAGRMEAVVCMKAANGEVVWEHKYDCPLSPNHVAEFGTGPRGTPLIVDDRIYTIGVTGKMFCLNKKTGKVLWSHDLWGDEFKGNFLNHGYSSSPVAYKDRIIALCGGKDASVIAFDQKTGKIIWKKHSFENSYSTPKLINVDGQDQFAIFMAQQIIGIDADTGDLKWSTSQKNQWKQNITLPIWNPEDKTLFITSMGDGAKALKLSRGPDNDTRAEQLWNNKKAGVHHSNAIRVGDFVYTTLSGGGGGGPSFIAAINVKTGEIAWKERGFSKANCLYADGKFYILDEDGRLGMAVCTPEGFELKAQYPMLKKVSWTVPTLVGKTLYIRDQDTIVALDVG